MKLQGNEAERQQYRVERARVMIIPYFKVDKTNQAINDYSDISDPTFYDWFQMFLNSIHVFSRHWLLNSTVPTAEGIVN